MAAVGFYNAATDCQADAGAVLLGGEEGLEYVGEHVRRDSRAGIVHAYCRFTRFKARCGNGEDPGGLSMTHRLDSVPGQVDDHLLDLNRVDLHRWKDAKLQFNCHSRSNSLFTEKPRRLFNESIYV